MDKVIYPQTLRFFAGPFYAIWLFPDKICTYLADRSIHAMSFPERDPEVERDAMKLGYFIPSPEGTPHANGDVFHYLTEKIILHNWIANRVYVRPSNHVWLGAHSDTPRDENFNRALSEESRIVKSVQAALNGLSWGAEQLSQMRMNHSLITDANYFFRNPDMTSKWRDNCIAGKHQVEPLLLPYGLSEKEPLDEDGA